MTNSNRGKISFLIFQGYLGIVFAVVVVKDMDMKIRHENFFQGFDGRYNN
jgi:hypothetical protein